MHITKPLLFGGDLHKNVAFVAGERLRQTAVAGASHGIDECLEMNTLTISSSL